jgi:hypothetical protein
LRAAVDEAADDEQRPSLAEQLRCEGQGTVLAVTAFQAADSCSVPVR